MDIAPRSYAVFLISRLMWKNGDGGAMLFLPTGGKTKVDHHPLDVWPLPREQKPMFINEPWLIDESIYLESYAQMQAAREPEDQPDNRRVYIPLDLNKVAFLRRLDHILDKYPDITWRNESNVRSEVRSILAQIEIYDQQWFVREGNFKTDENHMICGHSKHATDSSICFVIGLHRV